MDPEELRVRKVIADAIDTMTSYVVPIYKNDRGKPEQIGTGFFVLADGEHYFLSAGHVIEQTRKEELFIYIEPDKQMILTGKVRVAKDAKNIDVGVIKMTQGPMPPYLKVKKVPINIEALTPRLLPRKGKLLAIVGFPSSQSKVNPVAKTVSVTPYGYNEISVEDSDYPNYGLDQDTHIAMHLDLKKGLGSDAKHRNFPKPQGMSGSPIWLIHDYDGDEEFRAFTILGVGIEYRKKEKLLVATDISYGIELIESFA